MLDSFHKCPHTNREMFAKSALFILAAILLFHLVNNFVVLKLDNVPPMGHPGLYYRHSIELYSELSEGPKDFFDKLLSINFVYPPLLFLSAVPCYLFFGSGYDSAVLAVGTIYLGILLLSLYLVGRELFNPAVGLLSALFCSFFPAIFGYSRMFLMALPAVAITTLNIFLMIKSDCFRKKGYVLLFGMAAGAGMLMNTYYAISLSGVLVGYLIDKRKLFYPEMRRILSNLLLAFVIIFFIAGPWYIMNVDNVISELQQEKPIVFFGEGKFDFIYYLQSIIDYQIGIVFTLIFIAALGYLLFTGKLSAFLIFWLLWPYTIYSLIVIEKSPRYTMIMLPAIALIMALGIVRGFRKISFKGANILKLCLFFACFIYAIYNYYYISFSNEGAQLTNRDNRFFLTGLLYPQRVNWDIRETERILTEDNRNQTLFDAFGCDYFVNDYIKHLRDIKKLPIRYISGSFGINDSIAGYKRFIKEADYILMRSEDGSDFPNVSGALMEESPEKIKAFYVFFNQHKNEFYLAQKIFAHDEYNNLALLIYKRVR